MCLSVPQGVEAERQIWLLPTPGSPFHCVCHPLSLFTEVFSSRPHLFFTSYSVFLILAAVSTQHRASAWNLLFLSLVCSTLHQRLVTHSLRPRWGIFIAHCGEYSADAARSLVQMGEMDLTQLNEEKSQQCEKNWQLDDPTRFYVLQFL